MMDPLVCETYAQRVNTNPFVGINALGPLQHSVLERADAELRATQWTTYRIGETEHPVWIRISRDGALPNRPAPASLFAEVWRDVCADVATGDCAPTPIAEPFSHWPVERQVAPSTASSIVPASGASASQAGQRADHLPELRAGHFLLGSPGGAYRVLPGGRRAAIRRT